MYFFVVSGRFPFEEKRVVIQDSTTDETEKKYTASSGGYAKHEETKTKNSKNTAGDISRPSWRSEHILHQIASSFLHANSWLNSELIRIFTKHTSVPFSVYTSQSI